MQINLRDEISLQNIQITVTSSHGLIFSGADGGWSIDSANNVAEGDVLVSFTGVLHVIVVNRIGIQDRYTLSTIDGTVLASSVLVSTICAEEIVGGERLWNDKMRDWHIRHEPLFRNITVG